MQVNDRLRMEFMAECLGKRPAFLINAGEAVKPWPVNKLPTVAFPAFENIGTSSQGNCNSKLIRA